MYMCGVFTLQDNVYMWCLSLRPSVFTCTLHIIAGVERFIMQCNITQNTKGLNLRLIIGKHLSLITQDLLSSKTVSVSVLVCVYSDLLNEMHRGVLE